MNQHLPCFSDGCFVLSSMVKSTMGWSPPLQIPYIWQHH